MESMGDKTRLDSLGVCVRERERERERDREKEGYNQLGQIPWGGKSSQKEKQSIHTEKRILKSLMTSSFISVRR